MAALNEWWWPQTKILRFAVVVAKAGDVDPAVPYSLGYAGTSLGLLDVDVWCPFAVAVAVANFVVIVIFVVFVLISGIGKGVGQLVGKVA